MRPSDLESIIATILQNTVIPVLNLEKKAVTDSDLVRVAAALESNTNYKVVNLKHNKITDEGALAIERLLQRNKRIIKIDLSMNYISDAGALVISRIISQNPPLQDLKLHMNKITQEGAQHLARALLVNTNIRVLNLSSNNVGDQGCTEIILNANKLTELDLSGTHCGDNAAIQLGNMLKSSRTIRVINLSGNCISSVGANKIIEGLSMNRGLVKLSLDDNAIDGSSTASICEMLQGDLSLRELGLSFNKFTQPDVEQILNGIEHNQALLSLNLFRNDVEEEAILSIRPFVEKTIFCIDLFIDGVPFRDLLTQRKAMIMGSVEQALCTSPAEMCHFVPALVHMCETARYSLKINVRFFPQLALLRKERFQSSSTLLRLPDDPLTVIGQFIGEGEIKLIAQRALVASNAPTGHRGKIANIAEILAFTQECTAQVEEEVQVEERQDQDSAETEESKDSSTSDGIKVAASLGRQNPAILLEEAPDNDFVIVEDAVCMKVHLKFDNEILNDPKGLALLRDASGMKSNKAIDLLLNLGSDPAALAVLLSAAKQRGEAAVVRTLMGNEDVSEMFHSVPSEEVARISSSTSSAKPETSFEGATDTSSSIFRYLNVEEVARFESILQDYGISLSAEEVLSSKNFKHIVLLKLHPDKNVKDTNEDFVFVQELKEKYEQGRENFAQDVHSWRHSVVKGVYVGAISVDMTVDVVRLYRTPTMENLKQTVVSGVYKANIVLGCDKLSLGASVLSTSYVMYEKGLQEGARHGLTAAAFMAIPIALAYCGVPHVAVGLMIYKAATNAYVLYQELYSEHNELRSISAWRDIYNWLSETTGLFEGKTQEYDLTLNTIKISTQRSSLQEKLKAEHGEEFGNKLYEYIHNPFLEAKHKALDAVTLGVLSQEEAESALKTKLVSMPDRGYDVCLQDEGKAATEYYCSHKAYESIHHIAVSGNIIEVMEIL